MKMTKTDQLRTFMTFLLLGYLALTVAGALNIYMVSVRPMREVLRSRHLFLHAVCAVRLVKIPPRAHSSA